jgi:hypothetical protein
MGVAPGVRGFAAFGDLHLEVRAPAANPRGLVSGYGSKLARPSVMAPYALRTSCLPLRMRYPYPVPQLVWSAPVTDAADDDDPISMRPVAYAAVILAVVLLGLVLMMVLNHDAPTP